MRPVNEQVDLATLYALVPATEEEDLLQELAANREQHEWETVLRHGRCLSCWYAGDGPGEECCAVPAATLLEDVQAPELTPAQVLELVARELGGVVMEVRDPRGVSR